MCPKDIDGIANSVDPDQTRNSLIRVYTVCPNLYVRKLKNKRNKSLDHYSIPNIAFIGKLCLKSYSESRALLKLEPVRARDFTFLILSTRILQ